MVIPSSQFLPLSQTSNPLAGFLGAMPNQTPDTSSIFALASGLPVSQASQQSSASNIQSPLAALNTQQTGIQNQEFGLHRAFGSNFGQFNPAGQGAGNHFGQFNNGFNNNGFNNGFGHRGGQQLDSMVGMMSSMLDLLTMMFQGLSGSQSSSTATNNYAYPGTSQTSTLPASSTSSGTSSSTATTTPTPVPTPTPTPTPSATPIQPSDVNIVMIESVSNQHNNEVLDVLKSQVDQSDIKVQTTKVADSVNIPKNLNELKSFIANDYIEPLSVATNNLQQVVNGNDTANRVVNMSFGRTALFTMNFAKDALRANPQLLTQLGLPITADLNSPEVNTALVNLTTTELSNNANVQKAMQDYRNVTAQAAQKGIVIAVAGGNDQATYNQLLSQGINVDPAWSMNNLAFSNNVIVTGAIDNKSTAATGDDTLTNFGSMGSNSLHPSIAANGVNVNNNTALNGTSFSTPQVAAAAQKILEINAKLSADQVKNILLNTSSYSVGGMPVLDMNKAIAEAQRLASLGA